MVKEKMLILVGISGSGKTTFCKEIMEEDSNYVRINRDDLRLSLIGTLKDYYTNSLIKEREKLVTYIQDCILEEIGFSDFNCIIDNTNLDINYINNSLEHIDGWIEDEYSDNELCPYLIVIFDTPVSECKKRVMERDGLSVDEVSYIDKQHDKFLKIVEQIKNLQYNHIYK